MHVDLEHRWRQTLAHLEGRMCWAMLGVTYGSIQLSFGEKIPRDRPTPNDKISEDAQRYHGEFQIFADGPWRLRSSSAVLSSWREDDDGYGPGSRALDELVGNAIQRIVSISPARDLRVDFSNGFILEIFSDGTDRIDEDVYSIANRREYLIVRCGGGLRTESREIP